MLEYIVHIACTTPPTGEVVLFISQAELASKHKYRPGPMEDKLPRPFVLFLKLHGQLIEHQGEGAASVESD